MFCNAFKLFLDFLYIKNIYNLTLFFLKLYTTYGIQLFILNILYCSRACAFFQQERRKKKEEWRKLNDEKNVFGWFDSSGIFE